ncbi:hypothetical protein PSU4_58060 [Pseudonocardia sulfidoxydans NBRC 16205]|uniref:Pyruvate, phosphate dikinase n=1 Tax=Pseudonocardia sulfidoxydans NBRC 16205 TaxID=1223511 RepID=A0A511DPV2_9PSEU|nr:pyruvate, phosphate dikinase [Pseudonocardia sulfidoxydans]GEL26852.1 hypothetical protein PSU4_58060 [Pseudonocardia sulfidoxydans NBRC 16205]
MATAATVSAETNAALVVALHDDSGRMGAALLGGKGAGLARMTGAGLPVPPAFVITTEACRRYARDGLPDSVWDEVRAAVGELERRAGRDFGGPGVPLLVSVRSGAPVSMPGMMDTILNLGLNGRTLVALAESTSDPLFACETFARFVRMFGEIVLDVDEADLTKLGDYVSEAVAADDYRMALPGLVDRAGGLIREVSGESLPEEPWEQLRLAVEAVFNSWNSRRAVRYRQHYGISDDLGTAVVVQQMVFGNYGQLCGTGVAFTRDPRTGEPTLFGEFLERGQGEDIVSGTHTPESLKVVGKRYPELMRSFTQAAGKLEQLYRDILDIEFTVEDGTLYLLQVRPGKRTAEAAVRAAVDLVDEQLIDPATAVQRVLPDQVRQIRRPRFRAEDIEAFRCAGRVLATGVGAAPGQVSGVIVTDPDRAEQRASAGDSVVLLRTVTSPQDLHGMLAASAIVTARGGATSHAAVVARALDTTCVVGCEAVTIDTAGRTVTFGDRTLAEGDVVSVDGTSGEVFDGELPRVRSDDAVREQLGRLIGWADDLSGCELFTRVATGAMATTAIMDGAAGIGVRIDEVLAATGTFDTLLGFLDSLGGPETKEMLPDLSGAISGALADPIAAAGERPIVVRLADLALGRTGELTTAPSGRVLAPAGAWLPMGVPPLVRAQVRGVRDVLSGGNGAGPVTVMAGGVNGLAEVRALRTICQEEAGSHVRVGVALRSPAALLALPELLRIADVVWLDHRALTAAVHHYPDELILAEGTLDTYLAEGLLDADPRRDVHEVLRRLLDAAGPLPADGAQLGVNLVGWQLEEPVVDFYRGLGLRRFAVDRDELLPARLLFGRTSEDDRGQAE